MSNDNASTPENNEAAAAPANGNGTAPETSKTPPTLEELTAKYEEALKEEKNKYLYLYAEFENYKKRAVKERSDMLKFGWEGVARELLGVVDNLDRAIQAMPAGTDENLKKGIEMILNQFQSTLDKQGVKPVTALGQTFNPEIHEAMGQEPSDRPSGEITQELVKGYTLHGRLLRPSRVVVSSGKNSEKTAAVET